MSLDYWTPYYWGQERVGSLSSLLTIPLRDPITSALVRSWLGIFAGIVSIFAVMRYLGREHWVARGCITAALILLIFPKSQQFRFFVGQYLYGEAMALGMAAVLLLRPGDKLISPRGLIVILLLLLAHWVNMAVGVALAPLVIFHWLQVDGPEVAATQLELPLQLNRSWRNRMARWAERLHPVQPRLLMAVAMAFVANVIASRCYQLLFEELLAIPRGNYGFAPVSSWPRAWVALLQAANADYSHGLLVLVVGVACLLGIVALHWSRTRSHAWKAGRAAFVMLIAATAYFVVVAANAHVAVNTYNSRYMVTPVALLLGAATTFAFPAIRGLFSGIAARLPARWSSLLPPMVALLGLTAVIVAVYGAPRPTALRAALEANWGGITREAREAKCSHVLGDYWTVWPTVFQSRVLDRETKQRYALWGLTHRGMATAHQWRLRLSPSALRICIPHGTKKELRTFYRAHFRLPPLRLERRLRHLTLFVPRQ